MTQPAGAAGSRPADPRVSVLINNYNYGRFVGEAVESALAQDFRSAEIIVVDDGSTDGSQEVLEAFGGRIRVILQANGGQAAAMNAAVAVSSGDILCFLDSDDRWTPGKLSAVVEAFDADPGAVLVYHRLQPVRDGSASGFRPVPRSLCSGDLAPRMLQSAGWWPFPMTSAVSVRRSAWNEAGDIPDTFRISADAWLVGILPLPRRCHRPAGSARRLPHPQQQLVSRHRGRLHAAAADGALGGDRRRHQPLPRRTRIPRPASARRAPAASPGSCPACGRDPARTASACRGGARVPGPSRTPSAACATRSARCGTSPDRRPATRRRSLPNDRAPSPQAVRASPETPMSASAGRSSSRRPTATSPRILLIATTAVMARLLTPAETGLYLLANAVIMLGDNLRTFGTGVYIVQANELRREMVRCAFTVTLLLSLAMALAIFLAAASIARFYAEPDLAGLLRIAARRLLVIPFGSPIVALLQRELAFGTLAVDQRRRGHRQPIVTIGLGRRGRRRELRLGFRRVRGHARGLVALVLRPQAWMFRPCIEATPERIVSFGAVSSAVTVVNMASDMLPRLAFGKLLGFDARGLYGRAVTVCQLPDRAIVQALQPVVLPAMAARARAGGSLKEAYLRGYALMSAVQWPALLLLALLADPVVRDHPRRAVDRGGAARARGRARQHGARARIHDLPGSGRLRSHPRHAQLEPDRPAALGADRRRRCLVRRIGRVAASLLHRRADADGRRALLRAARDRAHWGELAAASRDSVRVTLGAAACRRARSCCRRTASTSAGHRPILAVLGAGSRLARSPSALGHPVGPRAALGRPHALRGHRPWASGGSGARLASRAAPTASVIG